MIDLNLQAIPEHLKLLFVGLHNENVRLHEKVAQLQRRLFGAHSEAHHIATHYILPKDSLFNEPEAILEEKPQQPEPETTAAPTDKPKKSGGGRRPLPDSLPRVDVVHEPENLSCQFDQSSLKKIGEEIVEKLDIKPAEIQVIRHIYPKYACSTCQSVTQAKAPSSAIPSSQAEVGTLAFLITQKYLYGLPLYRLESLLAQMGVDFSRVTMSRWMIKTAELLEPLIAQMKDFILKKDCIHADETTIQVLKGTGKSPTTTTYMWLMSTMEQDTPAVIYEYHPSRSALSATTFLAGFKGILHCDGYDGYNEFVSKNQITRVGCWAHVRRKFDVSKKDGAKVGQTISTQFLDLIQKLFMIERKIKEFSPDKKLLVRQEESSPVVDEIKNLVEKIGPQVLPSSKLGLGVGYLKNEWVYLQQFLKDGQIAISNNHIENLVRPFAVGRKNWLFANTLRGAECSAALYSLVITAKLNKLNVYDYLKDLLQQLPEKLNSNPQACLSSFLPWNWKPILH